MPGHAKATMPSRQADLHQKSVRRKNQNKRPAKEGQADRIADILSRFLPEPQREPGAKLFLISRARDNPAQFLFYELFRDEAAFKAHQESAHFKTYIAGEALPLLAKRERAQYALM
jgi:quinol monooxygenase YgiN